MDLTDAVISQAPLEIALSALRKDWSQLGTRIRTVNQATGAQGSRLSVRLHYPALRDARPTVAELIDAITLYLPHFCLPRRDLDAVYSTIDAGDPMSFHLEISKLNRRAIDLFMRAQSAVGRSGEAGELLLYILTEWILEAPQLVAKMSLKTNSEMPVHGSDGIHARYVASTGELLVFSGEAKLHQSLSSAIRSAVASISSSLTHDRMSRELELVRRDIDFVGLSNAARDSLLAYLNPYDECSNLRVDAVTCLIGFDFSTYAKLSEHDGNAEHFFATKATELLSSTETSFREALSSAGLADRRIELFLLPLPSVADLRTAFQDRIRSPQ